MVDGYLERKKKPSWFEQPHLGRGTHFEENEFPVKTVSLFTVGNINSAMAKGKCRVVIRSLAI